MLSSELNGKIDSVLVEEGELVKQGEELLEFDSSVIDAQIKVARLEADYETRIEQAETKYEYLKGEYERRKGLGKFISETKKEEFKQKMVDARLNVEELKRQRTRAEAQLDYYRAEAEQYTVTAPIAGAVSQVKVEAGEMAETGEELLEVIDPHAIEVQIPLPERYVTHIDTGQKALVRFESAGSDPYEGTVFVVQPYVDSTSGRFTVKVLVETESKDVVPGMECEVQFQPRQPEKKAVDAGAQG